MNTPWLAATEVLFTPPVCRRGGLLAAHAAMVRQVC